MIITVDTGILVRATSRSNGPARRLLQRIANDSSHRLALSSYIVAEVGKALSYPRMEEVLHITPDEIQDYLAYLNRVARIIEPEIGLPVVLTDPKDDPVIYTAVGAGADVLCARDRAFFAPNVVAFCRRYRLQVMNELRLLELFAESSPYDV